MKNTDKTGALPSPYVAALDLNDLLIDHPGASFIFQLGSDIAIVDRAAIPDDASMVVVENEGRFIVDLYRHQKIFGVITYRIRRSL
jgi:hypothetical protein